VKAWEELKAMDAPKTYESWTKARKAGKPSGSFQNRNS
jgi:hypothetical protein